MPKCQDFAKSGHTSLYLCQCSFLHFCKFFILPFCVFKNFPYYFRSMFSFNVLMFKTYIWRSLLCFGRSARRFSRRFKSLRSFQWLFGLIFTSFYGLYTCLVFCLGHFWCYLHIFVLFRIFWMLFTHFWSF